MHADPQNRIPRQRTMKEQMCTKRVHTCTASWQSQSDSACTSKHVDALGMCLCVLQDRDKHDTRPGCNHHYLSYMDALFRAYTWQLGRNDICNLLGASSDNVVKPAREHAATGTIWVSIFSDIRCLTTQDKKAGQQPRY